MKQFVTTFLICITFFAAGRASAQSVQPYDQSAIVLNPQIVAPGVLIPISLEGSAGHSNLNALSKVEPLSYFMDTTGNFFTLPGDDSFPLARTQGSADSSTFYVTGYAERFTSSLNKAYLDSVQILLGIRNVPNGLNFIVTHNREIPLNNGTTIPGVDLGTTAITSKQVLGSTLTQGQFQTVSVNFKHKLLTTIDHNFWVYVQRDGAGSFVDSVDYTFDANVQAERPTDTTIDRCNYVALDSGNKHYLDYTMAGRYFSRMDNTMHYYPNMIMIAYLSDPTQGVSESSNQPSGFRLAQNYPNPFNPSTDINYALPEQSKVTLKVTNALGQDVATLVNSTQRPGEHSVHFDASSLPSGTYFYTLNAGGYTQSRRMVLSK
jgi:hypothetical protein